MAQLEVEDLYVFCYTDLWENELCQAVLIRGGEIQSVWSDLNALYRILMAQWRILKMWFFFVSYTALIPLLSFLT